MRTPVRLTRRGRVAAWTALVTVSLFLGAATGDVCYWGDCSSQVTR